MNITLRGLARLWREYRATLLFLLLMLCFRSAWADWVVVPSGSMNPTILEGDRLLVDKLVGRATRVVVSLNPDRYLAPRAGRFLTPLD
jgi:signal peptidase I